MKNLLLAKHEYLRLSKNNPENIRLGKTKRVGDADYIFFENDPYIRVFPYKLMPKSSLLILENQVLAEETPEGLRFYLEYQGEVDTTFNVPKIHMDKFNVSIEKFDSI